MILGNKNELFLDDFLVESQENITFDLVNPTRCEVAVDPAVDNDCKTCGYQSVVQLPDGKIYFYYRGTNNTDGKQCYRLAVSDDGINFYRPDIEGDNIIKGVEGVAQHNLAPFYDTNPNCKEDERFKAVAFYLYDDERVNLEGPSFLGAHKSADGIHWSPLCEGPVLRREDFAFDSLNTVFWDKKVGKYRCFSRASTDCGRAIQWSESDDFIHWTTPEYVTYNNGNPPTQEFYTNSIRPIPGAEHQYVGFPMRINFKRKKVENHSQDGITDAVLISSRDGKDWVQRDLRPWIYAGLNEHMWTDRTVQVSAGIVNKNDEFSVYIAENYRWEDEAFVRYSVPWMRLGYAYSIDGSFVTKPFVLESGRLTFNYNTSALGSLFIDVLDADGNPIEGYSFELYGNELRSPIDLSALKGKTLKLKFGLKDAFLYSIGF